MLPSGEPLRLPRARKEVCNFTSLVSIGVDRMQRNFEPMRRQVEAWQRSELTDITAVTGDALHGWSPYMGDSYPYDWIKTLDVAEKLDFEYAIGGHGEVMRGKQTFELWKQCFGDLLDQTAAAYADGATLDQAKKPVSDYLVSKYAAKFDPKFPQSVGSNVITVYQVIAFAP